MIITDEDPGTVAEDWMTPLQAVLPWAVMQNIVAMEIQDIVAMKLQLEYGITIQRS